MLRMAHRILSQPHEAYVCSTRSRQQADKELASDLQIIKASTCFIADNVFEFLNGSEKTQWSVEDFPCVRMPFNSMWIEWKCDVRSGDGERVSQMGVACRSMDVSLKDRDKHPGFRSFPEEWASLQTFSPWIIVGGVPCFMNSQVTFAVRTDGTLDKWHARHMSDGVAERAPNAAMVMCAPALMALSFASCRNVEKRDVTNPDGPCAKWLRRMKQPVIRYYVLDIDPMKKVLQTEGKSDSTGIKKALHICRGHFATYTEDKPLFGHTVGTVWKPSHVRGDIKHGAVVKDYSIKK